MPASHGIACRAPTTSETRCGLLSHDCFYSSDPALEHALVDIFVLSHLDLFVGTYSSNFGQLVLMLVLSRRGFCTDAVRCINSPAPHHTPHLYLRFGHSPGPH